MDIITRKQLESIGFVYQGDGPDPEENDIPVDFFYQWWSATFGDFEVSVTTEYYLSGEPSCQYTEIDGQTLSKKNMTLQDLLILKNLL